MTANPRHRRITDDLRGMITRGELVPGDQLPSEAALVQQFGASRTTVRAALSALANEGLITSGSPIFGIDHVRWITEASLKIGDHCTGSSPFLWLPATADRCRW